MKGRKFEVGDRVMSVAWMRVEPHVPHETPESRRLAGPNKRGEVLAVYDAGAAPYYDVTHPGGGVARYYDGELTLDRDKKPVSLVLREMRARGAAAPDKSHARREFADLLAAPPQEFATSVTLPSGDLVEAYEAIVEREEWISRLCKLAEELEIV